MKTLIIVLGVILGINISNAQTINSKEIESFLQNHTIKFNKNQKPIACTNIDSMSHVLEKRKITYERCTYQFLGRTISDSTLMGGGCQTYILDKQKPFMYYNISINEFGSLLIEVLEGSNAF